MSRFCTGCGAALPAGGRFCAACGTPAAEPARPTTIGHYTLGAEIAGGGMGVVYRARDERLGRNVALKLLRDEYGSDREFRDRFVHESRAAASLDHPNILPVFDAGEIDGTLYLATRLVDGEDLRRMIAKRGPLPPARALRIIGQIGSALDFAHARGVVHRDVKPANVLVVGEDGDEHAYLIDFGITKRVEGDAGMTATGRFIGTPEYAAPEQITGGPIDGRADQYALAVSLFTCLTGGSPFAAESASEVLQAHLRDAPPRAGAVRPGLPPAVDAAIARALEKNPARRFASCRAFTAAAQLESAGTPPPAPPVRPATPAPPTVRRTMPTAPAPPARSRTPVAVWLVAAVLLAALGAGGVVLARELSGPEGDGAQARGSTVVQTVTGTTPAQSGTTTTPDDDGPPPRTTTTAATPERPAFRADDVDLEPYSAAAYTAQIPVGWTIGKDDELETSVEDTERRRTTVTDAARGVSVVIDHVTNWEASPRENRDTLDAEYDGTRPGYRRLGFSDYDLAGRATAEWRYELENKGGTLVTRVDLMFEEGGDFYAVMSTGVADVDQLASIAKRVAETVTAT